MTTGGTGTRSPGKEPADLIARARALAPLIQSCRDEIEEGRRLPLSLVEAMANDGLFWMWVPRSLDGLETDLATLLRVVEEVARADGAAAWVLAIGASAGAFAAHLPEDAAREIYAHGPGAPVAGSFNARGPAVAVAVDGGYRVNGRWGFVSGCQHSAWLACGCLVKDGDAPRLRADGTPELHVMLFPRDDASILDTWYVGGLRGTGSHDIAADSLFVPTARSFPLLSSRPREEGTLYRFPLSTLLAVALAPVATGIARAAIDALEQLATEKTPAGTQHLLRERPLVQVDVARAEALLRAARSFLYEAAAEAWEAAASAGELPPRKRALLRLAATHASLTAAQAVDLMQGAAGGTAIYASSPLERCFRDIHTLTQHAMLSQASYEPAGRMLLGMDPGNPRF